MKRAKTITGLLWQNITLRWAGMSGRGKTLVFAGLVLAGAVALHLGACFFGSCPNSAASEASPCDVPCNVEAAPQGDEPCPYAAAAAAREEAADEAAADVPPCHAE